MAFAHDTHRAHDSASIWTRLGGLRADLAERVAKYRLYRATVNELSSLSDRELHDLGLGYADIEAVALKAAYQA